MTREDAIAILKDIQNNQEEKDFLSRCALDLAIEALEDLPNCGTCHYWNCDLNYCQHISMFVESDDYCSEYIKRYEGTGGETE